MMLKCSAMPTAALGKGDRAQLPLLSSYGFPPGCLGNHSLTTLLLLEAELLRPEMVATVTGVPLSVWLAWSLAHPQGDEGRGLVTMATPESLQRWPLGFWRGWGRVGGWGRQKGVQVPAWTHQMEG
jgi:hypothetical protein